jgi:ClpP class serine protease
VAASGGYWLACAGDEIYASKSSIIGSIGVISAGFGLHKAIEKLGIERRIYTQGSNKSILDAFMPEKEQDVEIVKNLQAQIHKHFIEYVKTRRKNRLTQTDAILFNGEFWAGQTAVDFGLIDGIDNCFNFIKNKFGQDVKIIHCKARESFIKKYFSSKTDIIGQVKQQLMYDRYDL